MTCLGGLKPSRERGTTSNRLQQTGHLPGSRARVQIPSSGHHWVSPRKGRGARYQTARDAIYTKPARKLRGIRYDVRYTPKPRACKRKLNAASRRPQSQGGRQGGTPSKTGMRLCRRQGKIVCIIAHLQCLLLFPCPWSNRPVSVCIRGRLHLSDKSGSTRKPNL